MDLEKFKKLEEHAKDCGVYFGIYSPQYAKSVHAMNDYWKENKPKKLTFSEKVVIKRNELIKKWKRKNS